MSTGSAPKTTQSINYPEGMRTRTALIQQIFEDLFAVAVAVACDHGLFQQDVRHGVY